MDVGHVESSAAPVFSAKAVNVDQSFSDRVEVKDSSLVIPSSMLGKIEVGSIVAGHRAQKGTANPYGFLRKVTAIREDGANITLTTTPAEITDWLESGRIDFNGKRSIFSGAAPKSNGLTPKAEGTTGDAPVSGSVETPFEKTLDLSPGSVAVKGTNTVKASVDGFFEITRKELSFAPDPPTGASFKTLLTFDPSVAAKVVWSLSKGTSAEKSWKSADVVIPIAAPIPITVRYALELKCNVSASADGNFAVAANLGARAKIGFEGHASLNQVDTTNLSETPDVSGNLALDSMQGKATATASCELTAAPEVLLFDAVGISGRVGPYVNLTATACASATAGGDNAGLTLVEEHGLSESFNARVQIPVLGIGKDIALWSGKQNFGGPTYLVGTAETCNAPVVDSCAGKTDGFHCSETSAFAGIVCQGGLILKGLQCESTTAHCVSGDESAITCE